jgi:hypothetical protein
MARHFEAGFSFAWKPIMSSVADAHAIGAPEDIFSRDFLDAHLDDSPADIVGKQFFANNAFTAAEDLAGCPEGLRVDVASLSISSLPRRLAAQIPAEAMRAAFWRIGFSDKMRRAVDLAREVALPRTAVGLHLRAGDIVYGRYRYNARYLNKVVPYPLAIRFVETQHAAGRKVVLFGQDAEMCRWLAREHGAVFAGDLHDLHGLDVHQAALFDIVLMSRCAEVAAGNSGFSQIAQVIGGFAVLDPRTLFPPSEALAILRERLAAGDGPPAVSDLQRAFAYNYAVNFLSSEISDAEAVSFLEAARELDPDSAFYCLLLAIHRYRLGDRGASRATLREAVAREAERSPFGKLSTLIATRHPDGKTPLDPKVAVLGRMAEDGIDPAAAILALYHLEAKDLRTAKAVYARHAPASLDALAPPETLEKLRAS